MRYLLILVLAFSCAAGRVSAKVYSATGLVLQVDRAKRSIEISCDVIPGYMDAMVMTFAVRKVEALDALKPGMTIAFQLAVEKDAAYADNIHVRQYENTAQEPMATRQLEILDSATQAPAETEDGQSPLQVGQFVPNFSLVDQRGANFRLASLAGEVVAITFIYTRCPLPTFCFRMSNNFGVVHRRFADRMGKDVALLSITFDPEHDQPAVLAEYARTFTKDETGWYFLTGPPADVQKICRSFGVNAWQDEGLLTHPLHTVVLDRHQSIVANIEGNEFTAKQLGDLIESVIDRPN